MDQKIKEFIENHTELLLNENFTQLYNEITSKDVDLTGRLTRTLLEAGMDPLEYMSEIPSFYLDRDISLTDFCCPESIKSIGKYAFNECKNLTKLVIGTNVTSIDSFAFSWCKSLTNITIPDNIVSIGDGVFLGCTGLKHIIWNVKNCQELGWGWKMAPIFGECSNVDTLTIGDNVEVLPDYIFKNCTGLKTVILSSSVILMGFNVFAGCPNLASIDFRGTKIQWQNIQKNESWNENSVIKTVHCADGDIELL